MSTSTNEQRMILVAGAGKSSIYLIHYLLAHAAKNKWSIVVADSNLEAAREKVRHHPNGKAIALDIMDTDKRQNLVAQASLVVSVMPPQLHIHLAKDCLLFKKNLITSSYISAEMREMDTAVKEAGLMFMCEMGLDPGIDHMTASQIVRNVQRTLGELTSFKSYCGGLIAPESDDNPWHYKFSWNPRNIITAGADGAAYLDDNKDFVVPYELMFADNKSIVVNGLGQLAFYPNRDSLSYLNIYDVPHINTFLRATLRHPDFCKGWQAMISLGLTVLNDTIDTQNLTYAGWVALKTGYMANENSSSLTTWVAQKLGLDENGLVMGMLAWLGLFGTLPITSTKTNSGEILLDLLLDKWQMQPADKDMVVMQHEVAYTSHDILTKLTSTMVLKGENSEFSAMAKTVGLPMGILARAVMNKKLKMPTGVHIPNMPEVYRLVLKELELHGIVFHEEVS